MPLVPRLNVIDRSKQAITTMRNATRGSLETLAQNMVAWLKATPKPLGPPRLTGNLIDQIDYEVVADLAFRVVSPTGYSFWVVVGSSRTPGNDFYSRGYAAVKSEAFA